MADTRYCFLVMVDTNDDRPQAGRRIALELARAAHNNSMTGVQVFPATTPLGAMAGDEAIRYDPSRTVAQHLAEMEL